MAVPLNHRILILIVTSMAILVALCSPLWAQPDDFDIAERSAPESGTYAPSDWNYLEVSNASFGLFRHKAFWLHPRSLTTLNRDNPFDESDVQFFDLPTSRRFVLTFPAAAEDLLNYHISNRYWVTIEALDFGPRNNTVDLHTGRHEAKLGTSTASFTEYDRLVITLENYDALRSLLRTVDSTLPLGTPQILRIRLAQGLSSRDPILQLRINIDGYDRLREWLYR